MIKIKLTCHSAMWGPSNDDVGYVALLYITENSVAPDTRRPHGAVEGAATMCNRNSSVRQTRRKGLQTGA